jgi:hypothetical protein
VSFAAERARDNLCRLARAQQWAGRKTVEGNIKSAHSLGGLGHSFDAFVTERAVRIVRDGWVVDRQGDAMSHQINIQVPTVRRPTAPELSVITPMVEQ